MNINHYNYHIFRFMFNESNYIATSNLYYIIGLIAHYICVSLILHAIFMDVKQGIFSRRPTLVYYYEDRDYICRFVGKFIASLF